MAKKQKKEMKKQAKKARKELKNNFETACKEMDIVPSIPNVEGLPRKYQQKIIDHYMIMVVNDNVLDKIKVEFHKILPKQK